ncbi:MAG: branched-chain amino acid ABC transporter permease [Kiritimatiellae bacterium]|nr:branched-chain amino acid ABC transporter permease [Kiritimatiellia bacterium]
MKPRVWVPVAALAAFLIGVQILASAAGREYYLTQMIMAAYYAVVVMGLCLVMGYTGQISLGHGAFFAVGGYTSAVLTTTHLNAAAGTAWSETLKRLGLLVARTDLYGHPIITVSPGAAFLAAMLIAVALAALIGLPALRLKGHYLAMATLGFGLIVYRILLGSDFTGSADGITGVPPWSIGAGLVVSGRKMYRIRNYYIAWSLALAVLVLLLNLVASRIGRALRAIRDNEPAAEAAGVNTANLKIKVFIASALLAAAAGSFMTHYNGGIGPSEAGALKSVRYVALVAAGGMANLLGVLIISSLISFLSLRGYFGTLDHAVFGVLLIAIISLAPQGPLRPLRGWILRGSRRVFGRRESNHGLA